MKKPTVDYRGFSLSKLSDPRFSHLLLLSGWIVYFILFFITETFIPESACHVIHSPLDDKIPFLEGFVIPYVFWYLLIVITLVYFALYNTDSFRKFQIFIIITQALAMLCYIFYPSVQYLRPETYPRDNFLTDLVALIQTLDTPTGVCPSLHVAYSFAIFSAWAKEKGVSILWKAFVFVAVVLICLSTMFIKQHSVVDFYAALPVVLIAEFAVYGKWWIRKIRHENKS